MSLFERFTRKDIEEAVSMNGIQDAPPPYDSVSHMYTEEFLPDVREAWKSQLKLNGCGIHRNLSWDDLFTIHESICEMNILAGTAKPDTSPDKYAKVLEEIHNLESQKKINTLKKQIDAEKGDKKSRFKKRLKKYIREILSEDDD